MGRKIDGEGPTGRVEWRIAFQVYTWDKPNGAMVGLSLQPMLTGQADNPARKPTNRAVELANAGLWKEALADLRKAAELEPGEALFSKSVAYLAAKGAPR